MRERGPASCCLLVLRDSSDEKRKGRPKRAGEVGREAMAVKREQRVSRWGN